MMQMRRDQMMKKGPLGRTGVTNQNGGVTVKDYVAKYVTKRSQSGFEFKVESHTYTGKPQCHRAVQMPISHSLFLLSCSSLRLARFEAVILIQTLFPPPRTEVYPW